MLWGLMPVAAFAADTKIDSVEIKGMVVPQIGQKIKDMWDLYGVALDNGTLVVNNASYSAGYFGNLDSDGWALLDKNKKYINPSPEDAFTAGTYYVSNWFRATSGYTFADEVTVTVSGATSVETVWDGEWLGVYAKYVLTEPKPVNKSNPFKDVGKKDYFYDAVLWAVDKGVTTGTSKNAFSPAANCTRAQVVTFLWRAAGSPATAAVGSPATLRATAVGGSDTYSYNWQYSVSAGAAFQHCLGHPELFSGYDTATLTILNVTEDMAGYRFRCVVTNSGTTKVTESLALNIQP